MTAKRRSRRWIALSVRTMLIVVLAIGGWLGWWVNSAREQQAAVAAIRAFGGGANIWYDNEHLDTLGGGGGIGTKRESRPWWLPAWLEDRLGRDYFHNVVTVAFGQGEPGPGASCGGEILRDVARLSRLDQFVAYFPVRDADVIPLTKLRRLRRLEFAVDCPELTDEALRTLSGIASLEDLDIQNAPITDAGLIHLGTMPWLKSLTLGEALPFSAEGSMIAVTGNRLDHLTGRENLTELEIHSEVLTGEGLKNVGSLRHLKWLKLKGGAFADDDLRFLESLTELELLEISNSDLDGSGFRHLAGLSRVTSICLEGANVTDAAIPYLARLPSLKSVMIYGTRVTAAGLEEFRTAPRLTQMGLIPAVTGDTKRLKLALPKCGILNGGKSL